MSIVRNEMQLGFRAVLVALIACGCSEPETSSGVGADGNPDEGAGAKASSVTGGGDEQTADDAGGSGGGASGHASAGGDSSACHEALRADGDEKTCLCAPFVYEGPPVLSDGAPAVDWVVTTGSEDDDDATLVAMPQGGVLVVTSALDRENSMLASIGPDGHQLWQVELPVRNPHVGANSNGEIVVVFEATRSNVSVGQTLITEEDPPATFMTRVDAQSGEFWDAVRLPPAEGELWRGFEVQEDGFTVLRSASLDHVYRYDWSGTELWHRDADTGGGYQAAEHPEGGVVLGSVGDGVVIVRHLDRLTNEAWRYEFPDFDPYTWPIEDVQDVAVSPTGHVVVALHMTEGVERLEPVARSQRYVVAFDPSGAVTTVSALTSMPLGVEYVSDTDFVVWRASGGDETAGWRLTRYTPTGDPVGEWSLSARNDYHYLGAPPGTLAFRDGYLFASGAYVGGLDFGSSRRVDSNGCTDDFVARFGL